MTKMELHELVEGLPENTLDGAAVPLRSLSDGRIDPDQTWFWTPDWLAGELEADREGKTDPGEVRAPLTCSSRACDAGGSSLAC